MAQGLDAFLVEEVGFMAFLNCDDSGTKNPSVNHASACGVLLHRPKGEV